MEQPITLTIQKEHAGYRVDKLFSEICKEQYSRACIQKSIRSGFLTIDNVVVNSFSYRVKIG